MASFWNPEVCDQTMLPDRSLLIRQKLVENAKIQTSKWDILSYCLTLWETIKNIFTFLEQFRNRSELASLARVTLFDLSAVFVGRDEFWKVRIHCNASHTSKVLDDSCR